MVARWTGFNIKRTRKIYMTYNLEVFCIEIPHNMPLYIVENKVIELLTDTGGDTTLLQLEEEATLIHALNECRGMADAAYGVGDMLAGKTYERAAQLIEDKLNTPLTQTTKL
jgi:hypothetical protein